MKMGKKKQNEEFFFFLIPKMCQILSLFSRNFEYNSNLRVHSLCIFFHVESIIIKNKGIGMISELSCAIYLILFFNDDGKRLQDIIKFERK